MFYPKFNLYLMIENAMHFNWSSVSFGKRFFI